ncbi:MAG: site-specific DNA-methyltransferase [Chloroflexi bacterium]|nr:site-specific DNA-methyltransferase [Chloroflexota bacterium]
MNNTPMRGIADLTSFRTAEGRWSRLGPYYAMFPIEFARETIRSLSRPGDTVLDPFCGRGTAPYVAMVLGREAVGCDINPVAWTYAAAKTDPHPSLSDVVRRIGEVASAARGQDRRAANEFQRFAYCANALGFINAARRELDWRESRLDRTVAAFLLHYLHAKLGEGLSNQMRPSRAMSPGYSVRWWRGKGLTTPPDIDASSFLAERATWRYAKGVPELAGNATIALGDATDALPDCAERADLVVTSPPYVGVTNYRSDSWLRLWALGEGPPEADWSSSQKFSNSKRYEDMLRSVMQAAHDRATRDAVWFLRVDARDRTLSVARRVMAELLPEHRLYERVSLSPRRTQTALYGDRQVKPGDIDLMYVPQKRRKPGSMKDFRLTRATSR